MPSLVNGLQKSDLFRKFHGTIFRCFARLNDMEEAAGRLPAGWNMFCPPRLNGNMPVGRGQQLFIRGVMI